MNPAALERGIAGEHNNFSRSFDAYAPISAAYLMTSCTPGISAVRLQRQRGFSRYESAWTMLHELDRAMLNPGPTLLTGKVEVDECEVGGVERAAPVVDARRPGPLRSLPPLRFAAQSPGGSACALSLTLWGLP